MKLLKYISKIFVFIFAFQLISCESDFLETKPTTEYSDLDVWEGDLGLTESFVNMMYARLDDPIVKHGTGVFCDEAHRRGNAPVRNFTAGNITPDQIPEWSSTSANYLLIWNELFKSIRATNLFFEKIDRIPFGDDQNLKNEMTGEVYFCRAWYYFNLARMYGGVPIIDYAYKLDDDFEKPRSSFEEVIEFIISDLNEATALLPIKARNDGRATKGAAMALKSRVLITAASDLYNTNIFSGYSNPELVVYNDKSTIARAARWQRAKDAAQAVIDMGIYSLWQGTNDSISLNFVEYYTSIKNVNEDIFNRYITSERANYGNHLGFMMTPRGWGGQTLCQNPTGNHVDKYERRNGVKFDWNNPVHATAPYKYRDPRFYADILYEGAYWAPRPNQYQNQDPIGIVQQEYYLFNPENGTSSFVRNVLDWGCETLYYSRKYLIPGLDHPNYYQPITFRYLRYTEIIFNYVEACIELEQYHEARTYLNMIRNRAGMPDVSESGDQLRQRYRNEKSVEMFAENQRFWDIRRWAIGQEAYRPTLTAEITYIRNPDGSKGTIPTIKHIELAENPKRKWLASNKQYFFPIYRNEIDRNSLLVQNPGY